MEWNSGYNIMGENENGLLPLSFIKCENEWIYIQSSPIIHYRYVLYKVAATRISEWWNTAPRGNIEIYILIYIHMHKTHT